MLDVALLTANASQLRYVLQVGEEHEFYTLMVTLISLSIILQVRASQVIGHRLSVTEQHWLPVPRRGTSG